MVTPKESLEAIHGRFGRHGGCRALHAKGHVLAGTFTATPRAAELTRAAHMQGEPVGVTARLSNGSGDPDDPDFAPDVRGLAVKFYLPDGSRTDISAQSAPRFPVSDPDGFVGFLRAQSGGLSQAVKLPAFLATHPRTVATLPANLPALKPPASYATIPYYAVHAYRWVDAGGGEHFVRYTWRPTEGDQRLSSREAKAKGPDYLKTDLTDRIARGTVTFELELQIAAAGDRTDDPSAQWPDDRERAVAGTLELTAIDTEREKDGDVLVFDPTRVTDGIELSDDVVLNFRSPAYSESVEERSGRKRGAEIDGPGA